MELATVISKGVEIAPDLLAIAGGIVTTASIITAGTRTPNPNTFWGKCYRVLELFALVVGKAKQSGLGK